MGGARAPRLGMPFFDGRPLAPPDLIRLLRCVRRQPVGGRLTCTRFRAPTGGSPVVLLNTVNMSKA
jgi:hypothetical protein